MGLLLPSLKILRAQLFLDLAEALAIREGFHLASSMFCHDIIVEFDNLEIVEACRNNCNIGELSMLIEDIDKLRGLFHSIALV